MQRALVWDGMQGAKRSHGRSYGEYLQRRRPFISRDAMRAGALFSVALRLARPCDQGAGVLGLKSQQSATAHCQQRGVRATHT